MRQPEYYREMKACGFTVASLAGNDAQIDAAREAGMKVLLGNSAFGNRDWMKPDPDGWAADFAPFAEKYKDDMTGLLDHIGSIITEVNASFPSYKKIRKLAISREKFPLSSSSKIQRFKIGAIDESLTKMI